jgi:uncharacterized phage protein gp47/JayE
MPWSTPTLRAVRTLVRDAVNASLPGADANVPNSVLRVLSDNQGALCHLTLQYIDWLALQLLPDTAETEWLDRHGQIWLVNADGTTGRKMATLASGLASFQGTVDGTIVPQGTQLQSAVAMPVDADSPYQVVTFETLEDIVVYSYATVTGLIRALDPGSFGNLADGTALSMNPTIPGVNGVAYVSGDLTGGTDTETDDELRARILERIRKPPMGGDADDYVQWALAVPGVTRAWSYPNEMGIGTVTVRFMMDDLRADNGGFPTPVDVSAVQAYLDSVRPVAVKDFFVEAPIPQPINLLILNLNSDDPETRGNITQSLLNNFFLRSQPGQTWYRAWSDEGIINAVGVVSYDLGNNASDTVMPDNGHMPVLGDIQYARI